MVRTFFVVALLLVFVCHASPNPSKSNIGNIQKLMTSFADKKLEHRSRSQTLAVRATNGDGYNFDSCTTKADCAGERICLDLVGICFPDFPFCTNDSACEGSASCGLKIGDTNFSFCSDSDIGEITCSSSSDCDDEELCAKDDSVNVCTSKKYAEANNIDEVCIATHHLDEHGVAAEDRVFKKDYMAWVWCDAKESCATAGHMVVWNGQSMMMKSYCDLVGECTKKLMKVNSPKYGRKIRIGSRSEGLEFTAFAAKWATSTEERALSGLIRLGM